MKWHIPPELQGQTVEVSYGSTGDGRLWRRIHDRTDRSTVYDVADAGDCGCPGECHCFEPWNREPANYGWVECPQPPIEVQL